MNRSRNKFTLRIFGKESVAGLADDRSLVENVSDEVGEILCNLINGFRIFCSFVTR